MVTTTPEEVAAQLDAAEADAARHRAKLAAIRDAENVERHRVQLEHFTDAAGPRATLFRDERDEARRRLDDLAYAKEFDMSAVVAAFLDWRVLDKRCGALNAHTLSTRLSHWDGTTAEWTSGTWSSATSCMRRRRWSITSTKFSRNGCSWPVCSTPTSSNRKSARRLQRPSSRLLGPLLRAGTTNQTRRVAGELIAPCLR